MHIRRFLLATLLLCCGVTSAVAGVARAPHPQVEFLTNRGSFIVELYPDKAPKTVANFMHYVTSGHYPGTTFHRTIERFMIQGGGLDEQLKERPTQPPIVNESNNGLKNEPGTLAMARAYEPDSATAQFFINLTDNKFLNFHKPDPRYIGYAVFGKVIRGMETVERISRVSTRNVGPHQNVPTEPIIIEKVVVLDQPVTPDPAPGLPSGSTGGKTSKPTVKGKKRG